MASASDISSLVRTIGYENFTRWKTWSPDVPQTDIVPDVEMNVAKSVDISESGKVYTFHLRPGMKWSDGKPYTADDIMFWYEDVYSNQELLPTKPTWSVRGGKPLVVEKIDDYTVAFKFAEPNGLLLQWLATPANRRGGQRSDGLSAPLSAAVPQEICARMSSRRPGRPGSRTGSAFSTPRPMPGATRTCRG